MLPVHPVVQVQLFGARKNKDIIHFVCLSRETLPVQLPLFKHAFLHTARTSSKMYL
jgi:hypothetical protein